jgi:hypothetical protein
MRRAAAGRACQVDADAPATNVTRDIDHSTVCTRALSRQGEVMQTARRENPMEAVITFVVNRIVTPVTSVIPWLVESGVAFVIFGVMWIGFGAALVMSQGSLHDAWQWVRALPLVIQGLVWLLFLPVVVALWIYETTWHILIRLVVIGGLAFWSLLIFLPKWLTRATP